MLIMDREGARFSSDPHHLSLFIDPVCLRQLRVGKNHEELLHLTFFAQSLATIGYYSDRRFDPSHSLTLWANERRRSFSQDEPADVFIPNTMTLIHHVSNPYMTSASDYLLIYLDECWSVPSDMKSCGYTPHHKSLNHTVRTDTV